MSDRPTVTVRGEEYEIFPLLLGRARISRNEYPGAMTYAESW